MKFIRRILSVLFILILILVHFSAIAKESNNTLILPSSLKVIKKEAFYCNTSIGKVILSAGVTEIHSKAFAECNNITSITIPSSVTAIAADAFDGVSSDFTIYGESGSYAEKYASEKGINFTDSITFGTYPQTKEGNDKTPIEWLVLARSGNNALLLSRYGLDAQEYNTKWKYGGITWEKCTLRKWLNSTFMKQAFTNEEQKAILLTYVDNSSKQGAYSGVTGGNDTQDKIFLLSCAEAKKYLGVGKNTYNNIKARIEPTAYAIAQGASLSSSYLSDDYDRTLDGKRSGSWWLRSPGGFQDYAAFVFTGGDLNYFPIHNGGTCVRPAMWVNLDSDIFQSKN